MHLARLPNPDPLAAIASKAVRNRRRLVGGDDLKGLLARACARGMLPCFRQLEAACKERQQQSETVSSPNCQTQRVHHIECTSSKVTYKHYHLGAQGLRWVYVWGEGEW